MANIGLKCFLWAPLKSDDKTYDIENGIRKLKGAIENKTKFNFNEVELYADDRLKEKTMIFSKGDITLGIDDDHDDVFNDILGRKATSNGNQEYPEAVSNISDIAPYVGFGQVITKRIDNVPMFKAEFLPKVQFKPFTTDKKTKGNSLEYTTPSVEGNFYENADGDYEKHQTFKTYDEAVAYLNKCFGMNETNTQSTEAETNSQNIENE